MVTAALPWAAETAASPDLLQLLTVLGGLLLAVGGVGTFLAGRAASRRFVPDTYREMVTTVVEERTATLARKNAEIASLVDRLDTTEAEKVAVEHERDAWREKYYALRHGSGTDNPTGETP